MLHEPANQPVPVDTWRGLDRSSKKWLCNMIIALQWAYVQPFFLQKWSITWRTKDGQAPRDQPFFGGTVKVIKVTLLAMRYQAMCCAVQQEVGIFGQRHRRVTATHFEKAQGRKGMFVREHRINEKSNVFVLNQKGRISNLVNFHRFILLLPDDCNLVLHR
jgi:hypothetical protein